MEKDLTGRLLHFSSLFDNSSAMTISCEIYYSLPAVLCIYELVDVAFSTVASSKIRVYFMYCSIKGFRFNWFTLLATDGSSSMLELLACLSKGDFTR